MLYWSHVQLVLVILYHTSVQFAFSTRRPLYILGLYPMDGPWPGGEALLPATQLAIKHINDNKEILPGYELRMIPTDTKCDGGYAVDAMYRELYNMSIIKTMVLGCGCSTSTLPTAHASHLWNLVQLSYGAYSPVLSDRKTYPFFFRMVPPGSGLNVMVIAVMRHYGWRKVGLIHPPDAALSTISGNFRQRAAQNGIKIIASEIITDTDDPSIQVGNLKKMGVRIIYGIFYEPEARKVFCQAYRQGLYGAKYVWIILGFYQANWWQIDVSDCTIAQMKEATDGYLGVHAIALPEGGAYGRISNLSSSGYMKKYEEFVQRPPDELSGIEEAPFGYDAAWTAAIALNNADIKLKSFTPPRSIADFDYSEVEMANIVFDAMADVDFQGVSGTVRFSNNSGDRLSPVQLEQNQHGTEMTVATFDPVLPNDTGFQWTGKPPIQWHDGKVPVDSFILRYVYNTISFYLFVAINVTTAFGIVLAFGFLVFNVKFSNKRMIKMSSPRLNNAIIVGAMLSYMAILFLGIDVGLVTIDKYCKISKIFTWSLVTGISLSFGAMFSKTWRVHRIFTTKSVIPKKITDGKLFITVAALVALDVLVLLIWEIVDPTQPFIRSGAEKAHPTDSDILIIRQQVTCSSKFHSTWLGILFVIHGLLMVLGVFLAWETRNVKVPVLNDSKHIGMSVYTVVIMSFTGVPVAIVIDEPNVHYALISTFIFFPTTLTLCLVFIPKVKIRNDVMPRGVPTCTSEITPGEDGNAADINVEKHRGKVKQYDKATNT